jgi:dipeptidyl aminopeptidase/acylaminoacyl peptidase
MHALTIIRNPGRCAILLATALALSATQAFAQQPAGWTPDLMMRVRPLGVVRVSPDGRQVLYTVREAVMTADKSEFLTHVWIANADGSESRQLTRGEKSATEPRWSPDGRSVAFVSSRSGKANVWTLPMAGGEAEQLTDVKSGVQAYAWAPDGRSIAFTMAVAPSDSEEAATKRREDQQVVGRNLKMVQLWVVLLARDSAGKRAPRVLTDTTRSVDAPFDWSPDSRAIVYSHVARPEVDDWPSADLSIVEVATGRVTPLATTAAAEADPRYSPDGRWIAFVASDAPPTWATTQRVNVVASTGGLPRPLAPTFDEQVDLLDWSADGQRIYFTEARRTRTALVALPVAGGPPEDVAVADGVFGSINIGGPQRSVAAFAAQAPERPPEAFVAVLGRWQPMQVSRVNADLAMPPLGRTEVIRWRSPDGTEVEGLLTYPAGYQRGQRVPLILQIHGGPTGVFQESFIGGPGLYPIAAWASRGWAVLRANPRGSSGYGKRFRYANYGDWGGGDFRDLMAGVDYVIRLGVGDSTRLGVSGWSYGGYMTSWIVTQTQRFRAAAVGAGVTNLMSFTGTADIPSFIPDYFRGEFWTDLEPYRRHSAMFNVRGVHTPTLILHGEADARVPISQGYELHNALRRQGVTVEMVTYPRAPHGPSEPRQQLDIMGRHLDWFARYLGGGTAAPR